MISFSDFLRAKSSLLQSIEANPTIYDLRVVTKYCKVPVEEEGQQSIYIDLRPRDIVEAVYVKSKDGSSKLAYARFICPHNKAIEETKFHIKWVDSKVFEWISRNTEEIPSEETSEEMEANVAASASNIFRHILEDEEE